MLGPGNDRGEYKLLLLGYFRFEINTMYFIKSFVQNVIEKKVVLCQEELLPLVFKLWNKVWRLIP